MGDFKGHALPGTLFYFCGLWWVICALRRYFSCRRTGVRYVSTASFSCPCPCGRLGSLPIEGFLKIFLSAFGMLAEITFNLPHPAMGIIQHATMYFFFMMSGIVDLVVHFGVAVPPGSDYASLILAVFVEGLLFANHLHEREELDVQIHILLVYVIFLSCIVIALEVKYQNSIILTLSRAFLTMLQGTWFWAVGIILYGHGKPNKVWKLDNPMDVMQATIYFSWHCAFHFIFIFIIVLIFSRCFKAAGGAYRNGGSELQMSRLEKGGKAEGYRMLAEDQGDDGSDIEFEKPVDKVALLPS